MGDKKGSSQENSIKFVRAIPRLLTNDGDKAVEFYGKLGFQVGYRDEGFIIFDRDSVSLQFNVLDEETPGKHVCYIEVENIDSFFQECKQNHVSVSKIGDTSYGMREFVVNDPMFNIIIFAQNIET